MFSTVNVQHLESLNDQVARLTGATVRETIPDEILSAADEVVLIDLTPEALIARLRAGKVYRPERVPAALNNFFKIENLAALRETALRQVAEDVEVKRLVREPPRAVRRDEEGRPRRRGAGAAGDLRAPARARDARPRVRARRAPRVALGAAARRRARRAGRAARRGASPSAEDRGRLEALRRLTSMLGARLRVEEGDDVAAVAIDVARALGSTYVLIGAPPARGAASHGCWPGGESLLTRLLEGLPGRRRADRRRPRRCGAAAPADKDLLKAEGVDGEGGEGSGQAPIVPASCRFPDNAP